MTDKAMQEAIEQVRLEHGESCLDHGLVVARMCVHCSHLADKAIELREHIRLEKHEPAAPHSDLAALEKQAAIEWSKRVFHRGINIVNERQDDKGNYWYLPLRITPDWTRACTILEANNRLERHDENKDWVRIRDE